MVMFNKPCFKYLLSYVNNISLQKQAKLAQIEKEEFARMDRSLQCPSRFLKPLRHQTRMSDPTLHVKHMKYRLKSPSGFIGRKLLMVS